MDSSTECASASWSRGPDSGPGSLAGFRRFRRPGDRLLRKTASVVVDGADGEDAGPSSLPAGADFATTKAVDWGIAEPLLWRRCANGGVRRQARGKLRRGRRRKRRPGTG
ncbi:hypothetical protein HPP92_009537 [Vanilla planifolia]|uniref:Uncharacterized protein n=1 Tax=Vanilla planifolia TaxID=51239 RepID=A0A835R546_VANPL|nr:hypothetical protein HPP92_009739 [Vanilla planifolia]KAG0487442.1 hypothetical protein HPP92_009537 [Vanilla planifolia]